MNGELFRHINRGKHTKKMPMVKEFVSSCFPTFARVLTKSILLYIVKITVKRMLTYVSVK